ncbi:MAG: hypothetical protein ACK43K_01230, partial [Chitinophagales bacterium]
SISKPYKNKTELVKTEIILIHLLFSINVIKENNRIGSRTTKQSITKRRTALSYNAWQKIGFKNKNCTISNLGTNNMGLSWVKKTLFE